MDAMVDPVRHVSPGGQTRAGTPWLDRPFATLTFTTELRKSEVSSPSRMVRAWSVRAYLIASGLQSGWSCMRMAAAPATWGAANEVPLIVA